MVASYKTLIHDRLAIDVSGLCLLYLHEVSGDIDLYITILYVHPRDMRQDLYNTIIVWDRIAGWVGIM